MPRDGLNRAACGDFGLSQRRAGRERVAMIGADDLPVRAVGQGERRDGVAEESEAEVRPTEGREQRPPGLPPIQRILPGAMRRRRPAVRPPRRSRPSRVGSGLRNARVRNAATASACLRDSSDCDSAFSVASLAERVSARAFSVAALARTTSPSRCRARPSASTARLRSATAVRSACCARIARIALTTAAAINRDAKQAAVINAGAVLPRASAAGRGRRGGPASTGSPRRYRSMSRANPLADS